MGKKKTLGKRKQLKRLREQLRILNEGKKKKPNISFIELENVTNKTAPTVLENGLHEDGSARGASDSSGAPAVPTSLSAAAADHLEQGKGDSSLSIDSTDKFPDEEHTSDRNHAEINEESDERRIIDLKYFLKELKTISNHSTAFGCGINNLELIGDKRLGLISKLKLKCNMCNVEFTTHTSKPSPSDNLNVNTAVVTSAVITGVGYTQLQEIFTSINVPFMTEVFL
ncbi:unnamed protein product [Parnassius apollo]|uniref:(apollo) hypothetical protein n=1 Tax=Parnassius apollo TaxID=110799 RepID=A0A8S3X4S2_PARAO|nr:unnamed protein product [Parnassius apollo]